MYVYTPLMFSEGHVPVVLWLLDHGAQAGADNFGNTPLHDAAEHGQIQVREHHHYRHMVD